MVMQFLQMPGQAPRPRETPGERDARVHREEESIAQGHAQIAAGQCIEDDDILEAWLDALDQDENTPLPSASSVRS